jgi:hypothetical protein
MPENYLLYTNNESGTKSASYHHNDQKLAENTIQAALGHGVAFPPELDALE